MYTRKTLNDYQASVRAESLGASCGEYERHYCYGDRELLASLLQRKRSPAVVAEAATGPNIIVASVLEDGGFEDYRYISVDVCLKYLKLHQQGLRAQGVNGRCYDLIATAAELPIRSSSVDIFVLHHAINDIWASDGISGVEAAVAEVVRTLKRDGIIVSSDAVFAGVASTLAVSHEDVKRFLSAQWTYELEELSGDHLEWLVVSNIRPRPPVRRRS